MTPAIEAIDGGKIRVNASSWDAPKVILAGEVLEVRAVEGRLRLARKVREYDEKHQPVEPYDPYGPGDVLVAGEVSPTADGGEPAEA